MFIVLVTSYILADDIGLLITDVHPELRRLKMVPYKS